MTPEPQRSPSIKPPTFQEFKTFNEIGLIRMLDQARQFAFSAREPLFPNPYWISFCGTNGGGKTFLANIIFNQLRTLPNLALHFTLISGVMKIHWPTLVPKLYNREMWRLEDATDANLLLVDEIACSADNRGIEREWLWRLLSGRQHKWTIITSNHSLQQIAEQIDARVASRMIRDGSVVVEVNTVDFSNR